MVEKNGNERINQYLLRRVKLKMRYECPRCGCKKNPKVVKYFPPKVVQCTKCFHEGSENEFIIDDISYNTAIYH